MDEESMLQWNEDTEEDVSSVDFSGTIVYSRDWTIGTIINQIELGNIDLNPSFQRRNAWNDNKRSLLIESLVIGVPVPQIVLAEHPNKKRAFIVLDGKQRLNTLIGFVRPNQYPIWGDTILNGLSARKDLNGSSFESILGDEELERLIMNADMRTSVISGYKTEDTLYNIFYRINSGSVPLSTQELRQSLHPGEFAKFLVQSTSTRQPIHDILSINRDFSSDDRFRDVELLLRYYSLKFFINEYRGNLKLFLDSSLRALNDNWESRHDLFITEMDEFNRACERLAETIGGRERIGRRPVNEERWERRFNKSLFDVELYYFRQLKDNQITEETKSLFKTNLLHILSNTDFRKSIESTTKSIENYQIRFSIFGDFINSVFGSSIEIPRFERVLK